VPEPFLATLFSISSHHPYKVPARYEGKFKKGRMHVEEVISYTDYALGRLFDTLATLPSYSRTLFVITADHGSALNRPEYQTMVGRFRIPLLFFRGDGSLRGWDDRPAQQLDVLPTVLHLAGATAPFVAFGNDLLAPDGQRFVINFADGTFQLIQGEWALHWDGTKTTGLFRYAADPLLADDRSRAEPEVRERLETLIKAVLQQFNGRMIDDHLTTTEPGQARLP
jgi:phosphoglycerol transferase MdoB-like AlkP superfamily enzyme